MQVPTGPITRDTSKAISEKLISLKPPFASSIGANRPNFRGGAFTTNVVHADIFPVKLTAVTSGLYAWTEQIQTGSDYSGFEDLPGGRFGTVTESPAYEPNDVAIDVTDEPIVFLMLDRQDPTLDWVYVMVGGAGTSLVSHTISVVTAVTCNDDGTISVTTTDITYYGPA